MRQGETLGICCLFRRFSLDSHKSLPVLHDRHIFQVRAGNFVCRPVDKSPLLDGLFVELCPVERPESGAADHRTAQGTRESGEKVLKRDFDGPFRPVTSRTSSFSSKEDDRCQRTESSMTAQTITASGGHGLAVWGVVLGTLLVGIVTVAAVTVSVAATLT